MGRSWFLAIASASALAGCASVLGFDTLLPGVEQADGGGPDAGPVGEGEAADARWYVSPAGDDANDGTRERPVRSVVQAVRLADGASTTDDATDAGSDLRIAVCAGDYVEPVLTIAGPVEIRGNYDCTTWRRPRANDDVRGASFGSSSKLSLVTQTSPVRAFVELEDRSGAPFLDGLDVRARTVGTVIAARGGARLHELTVTYEADPAHDIRGVAAVTVEGAASVEHSSLVIQNVGTVEAPVAAVGISLGSADATVRRNSIELSTIQGACIGVNASRSALRSIENQIRIDTCAVADEGNAAVLGMGADSTQLTTTRDTIELETIGHAAAKTAIAVGIVTAHATGPAAPVEIDGDVLVAPTYNHPLQPASALTFVGVGDNGCVRRIVNTSVVLDAKAYALEASYGFAFFEATAATVAHNSLFLSGLGTDAGPPAYGLGLLADVSGDGTSSATVLSNLAVSDDDRIVFLKTYCPQPGVVAALHNRFAGLHDDTGSECPPNEGFGVSSVDASDNGGLGCDGGCGGLFPTGPGEASTGLRLVPAVACPLDVAVPFTDTVPQDGTGADRNKNVTTVGAFELACP